MLVGESDGLSVAVDVMVGGAEKGVGKARLQQVHRQERRVLHYLYTQAAAKSQLINKHTQSQTRLSG